MNITIYGHIHLVVVYNICYVLSNNIYIHIYIYIYYIHLPITIIFNDCYLEMNTDENLKSLNASKHQYDRFGRITPKRARTF